MGKSKKKSSAKALCNILKKKEYLFGTAIVLGVIVVFSYFSFAASPKTICVDPGHPPDGAEGEAKLNLTVAKELKAALVKRGYKVVLTRTTAKPVSLDSRVKTCKNAHASLLYSLHADNKAIGYPYQIYPSTKKSKIHAKSQSYASTIQNVISESFTLERGFRVGTNCEEGKGTCTGYSSLAIMTGGNKYKIPVVLTEMAQLDAKGNSYLNSAGLRNELVNAMADGIKEAVK